MNDFVLITDHGLGLLSFGLSVVNISLIVALAVSLRARLRAERLERIAMGREHGITGSVTLLMLATLAIVTSIGPAVSLDSEAIIALQVIALSIRLGVTLVLLAWLAASLQARLSPERKARVDRLLHMYFL